MTRFVAIITGVALALLAGCDAGPSSPRGFSLPAGNVEAGKMVFNAMNCNACHSIGDIEQASGEFAADIRVQLGGPTSSTKTYAELVTAVINPSHRMARGYAKEMIMSEGESKMPNYNSLMTVSQLIDLVTFLESNYELQVYTPSVYPIVY